MEIDIHNYPKRLERVLTNLESTNISPANRSVIKRFFDDCSAQGLSKPRLIKIVEVMITIAQLLNIDFEQARIADIKALVSLIEQKVWSTWTKITHRVITKKFYKWLRGNGDQYPEEVRWIKTTLKNKDTKLLSTNELLTDQEILAAIRAADHPRNKAFLSTLGESGCRIGEIGSLLMKNIAFDKHGAVLTVNGKTGPRRIRVVQSAQHLATWLNCHPANTTPDAPVWINVGSTNHHKAMQYNAFTKTIRDAFRRAGIRKRCNPHLFRHSRASLMANHLTEFQMNHYFGWTQGSDMPSTYVHLSGKDIDGAILKLNGVESELGAEQGQKAVICSRCETINSQGSLYCSKCAAILDNKLIPLEQRNHLEEEEQNNIINEVMSKILQDENLRRMIADRIISLGLAQKVRNTL